MPHVLCALLNNARLRGRLNACCLRCCEMAKPYSALCSSNLLFFCFKWLASKG